MYLDLLDHNAPRTLLHIHVPYVVAFISASPYFFIFIIHYFILVLF